MHHLEVIILKENDQWINSFNDIFANDDTEILPYDPEDVKSHLTVPYLRQIDNRVDASPISHVKMLPMTGGQLIFFKITVNKCGYYWFSVEWQMKKWPL